MLETPSSCGSSEWSAIHTLLVKNNALVSLNDSTSISASCIHSPTAASSPASIRGHSSVTLANDAAASCSFFTSSSRSCAEVSLPGRDPAFPAFSFPFRVFSSKSEALGAPSWPSASSCICPEDFWRRLDSMTTASQQDCCNRAGVPLTLVYKLQRFPGLVLDLVDFSQFHLRVVVSWVGMQHLWPLPLSAKSESIQRNPN